MTDKASWQMARIASRRPLPKPRELYKGTVGERQRVFSESYNQYAHECCGMHMCVCSTPRGDGSPLVKPGKVESNPTSGDSTWMLAQLRAGKTVKPCGAQYRCKYRVVDGHVVWIYRPSTSGWHKYDGDESAVAAYWGDKQFEVVDPSEAPQ